MKKFWNWKKIKNKDDTTENILFLNGTIAEESWFDDDITPGLFKSELEKNNGDITVWINSPGGDVIAAAQIYNMLMDHKGNVTVKIDGIAASAASVIAMAGTKVLMSPVSMMMIHNPMTIAFGDKTEMKRAISMLDEIKDSIVNAYEIKTSLSRDKISKLMDEETWMNANKAMEMGFCDDIMKREINEDLDSPSISSMYSSVKVMNHLMDKIATKAKIKGLKKDVKAEELNNRLNLIKIWR
ncbi:MULTISPECIES: head maturation protease, ClpP-related [Helcococcus]|uniref:ATP-dependent Clp protease proteolytic subunit n=1 Tax=Helcococcus bovis TaxID=3153252 RepID=A0ABW9F5D0_9FIRM